jgi:serine/threonine protein kinase
LLRDRLGVGAMGAVYSAVDRRRGENVALKTLHHMTPSAIYAIKEEFRALADVVHPNLVTLYELFADGEHWFFTMELVEGVDFLAHLKGSRHVVAAADFEQVRLAIQQLVAGIEAIHRAGKLHLDLKPTNVLVTRDGRVVILDFGLVREPSPHQPDQLLGTPAYMAPEQAMGNAVTEASDWYAMGVMMFEALTGRRPFEGPAVRALADKLLKPPPSPSLFAKVPHDLDELCLALLSREPVRRPRATEIRHALGMPPLQSGRASLAPNSQRPVFVGRDEELSRLYRGYGAAIAGRCVLNILVAPSGMGKTALAKHFISSLPGGERRLVFSGRCFERESVPYNAIDNLIDELGTYLRQLDDAEVAALLTSDPSDLVRAFPVLRDISAIARYWRQTTETADVKAAKRQAIASLREIIGGLARGRTIVLFIDDLQWADLDSIRLLEGIS